MYKAIKSGDIVRAQWDVFCKIRGQAVLVAPQGTLGEILRGLGTDDDASKGGFTHHVKWFDSSVETITNMYEAQPVSALEALAETGK